MKCRSDVGGRSDSIENALNRVRSVGQRGALRIAGRLKKGVDLGERLRDPRGWLWVLDIISNKRNRLLTMSGLKILCGAT